MWNQKGFPGGASGRGPACQHKTKIRCKTKIRKTIQINLFAKQKQQKATSPGVAGVTQDTAL